MRKSILFILILLICCFAFIGVSSASENGLEYGYGVDGTKVNAGDISNPYAINDLDDFKAISSSNWGTNVYYRQTEDIRFDSNVRIESFMGHYNGDGFTIDCNSFSFQISLNANAVFENSHIINIHSDEAIFMQSGSVNNCFIEDISISNGGCSGLTLSSANTQIHNTIIRNSQFSGGAYYGFTWFTSPFLGSTTASAWSGGNVISNCVAISTSASGSNGGNYRVAATGRPVTITNCYASSDSTPSSTSTDPNSENGATITAAQYNSQSWWQNTANYDFSDDGAWEWDSTTNLPKLKHKYANQPPTISAITSPTSPSPINSAITSTVTAAPYNPGGSLTYNWQTYSNSAWTDISGQTTATLSYTPTTTGTYQFRVIVTEPGTGLSTTSSTISTVAVTAPTIGSITITPTEGKLNQQYTPTISIPITGMGGAATVYYKLQTSTDGTSWTDTGTTGTATSTGTKTISHTVTDTAATTHSYRVLATTISGSYSGSTLATSNTVTFKTYAAPAQPTVVISPATITVSTATTVQLSTTTTQPTPTENPYTYTWSYGSGQSVIGTWTNPAEPYSWNIPATLFPTESIQNIYLTITDSLGQTVTSNPAQLQILPNAPTLGIASISISEGKLNQQYTPTISIPITGLGGAATVYYKLQTSTDGTTWTDTGAAGTATSTGTKTLTHTFTDTAATTHSYRVLATTISGSYSGSTLATSNTVTFQTIAAPVFTSVNPPQGGPIPLTITFSAAATDASSIIYLLSSDDVTYSEITSPYVINTQGTYYWKAKATGIGGETYTSVSQFSANNLVPVITSATVSPTSGLAPFTVTFSAAATNSPTFTWYEYSQGVDTQIGSGATLTYTMRDRAAGEYTFRVKAVNQYGTAYSNLLTVTVGSKPQTTITEPTSGTTKQERSEITFTASYSGSYATNFVWDFGDGETGTGASTTHRYYTPGTYTVTATGTNQFGSDSDSISLTITEYAAITIDIDDITSTGVTVTGTINDIPVLPDTVMYFKIKSTSGQTIWQTDSDQYFSPVTFHADGLPMIAGQTYSIQAFANNGYGNSADIRFTLDAAERDPQKHMDTIYTESGLSRDPFNVSKLVEAGTSAYGEAMGGGTVGAAIAFGLIVVFVAIGLWLRQGHFIIPLGIALAGGWFVIGNLPGEWQPIAYTLMVICIVAILFVLFRKQHES